MTTLGRSIVGFMAYVEDALLRLRKILARPVVWQGGPFSHHSAGPRVLDEQDFSSRELAPKRGNAISGSLCSRVW